MLILNLNEPLKIKTYKELTTSLERFNNTIKVHHTVLNINEGKDNINKFFPNSSLTEYCAMESSDADLSDRVADKLENFIVFIFKTIYKLSVSIWKKIVAFFGKILKFVGFCIKRSDKVKKQIELTMIEGRKLINAVKIKCDTMIKTGMVTNPELVDLVDKIKYSTGSKNGPIDPQSAISVRQWLETLNSIASFKRVEGLEYYIPETHWIHFSYNRSLQVFTTEYTDFHTNLNNYYFKYAETLRGMLSGERLQHVIVEQLSNKLDLNRENVTELVTKALIEPILKLDQPSLEGNISESYRIDLPSKTMDDIYSSSRDKLNGFDAAISSYLCAISQADKKDYVPYQEVLTDIKKISAYSVSIGLSLKTIYANGNHLKEIERGFKGSTILTQQQILNLLNQILNKETVDVKGVTETIMQIIKVCDKLISQAYLYWERITNYQFKALNNKQTAIMEFLPKV